jgi:hypothetical protein
MELHFKIIGIVLMLLALIHIGFPKRFNWAEELKPLSLMNRQMMVVHTFFIAIVVFMMGALSLFCSTELSTSSFGKIISMGLGMFWTIRLYVQFFVYSPELWKGKKFETTMHILFSFLWLYLSGIFLWNAFRPIYD